MDDFTGTSCNQGKYPLLTTINSLLGKKPVEMPREHIHTDDKAELVTEADFFQSFSEKNIIGSFNVFNLIQNDGKTLRAKIEFFVVVT
jgi:hypothetical protein